jgi:hypothetical protein
MINETGDIIDFIYLVFEKEPKGAKSLYLTLDYSHLSKAEEIVEYKFKSLLDVFIAGCKLKYGNVILLEEMKGERLEKMNKYFNSFSYKVFVNEVTQGSQFKTRGEKLELKDYYLKINRNGMDYYIYFDELNKE